MQAFVFRRVIHAFQCQVSLLILPVFWQLLLRHEKISSKSLIWNKRTQRADSRWQVPQVTLLLYIFKLLLYFNSSIINNQMKYYLAINRSNFLQIQYGFYRHALQILYQLWWIVIERACTKNSGKLMSGTWLLGASCWEVIRALSLHEIVHISWVFWQEELWQGLVFD